MKKIMSALLAGAMLFSSVPAYASDIDITINGEEFIPKNALGEEVEPFIENGSTYLPVRAMGEAVGKEVMYDGENNSVYIGTKPTEEEAERTPVALVGDRVFYQEDLMLYGTMDMLVFAAQVECMAMEKFSQSQIDSALSMTYAFMDPRTLSVLSEYGDYVLNEYINHTTYVSLLKSSVVVDESVYENYVTAQHILVTDMDEAAEVLARLESGEDFSNLIEEYNIDPGQKKDSAYTFTYGEMVEEFETAAFSLEENTYTKEAVKTSYGYHIVKRLPLDKEMVNTEAYVISQLEKEINEIKFDKIIAIEKSGNYGVLEGYVLTVDELKKIDGENAAPQDTFVLLENLVRVKTIFDTDNMLSDEEKAEIVQMTEYYQDFYETITDSDKAAFLASLTAYYGVFMNKVYDNAITDEFYEKLELVEVDSSIYKEIKVYVDGKLIVPGDVNSNYVSPKNINGTVYVPVRAIVEALGMEAGWDNDTRTVVITK